MMCILPSLAARCAHLVRIGLGLGLRLGFLRVEVSVRVSRLVLGSGLRAQVVVGHGEV
jgi:hypothetical protein